MLGPDVPEPQHRQPHLYWRVAHRLTVSVHRIQYGFARATAEQARARGPFVESSSSAPPFRNMGYGLLSPEGNVSRLLLGLEGGG